MKLETRWHLNMHQLTWSTDDGTVLTEIMSYQTLEDICEQFGPLFRLSYFYKNGVHPSEEVTEMALTMLKGYAKNHQAMMFVKNFEENMERMCR